jgi:hypothetical protein
VIDKPKILDKLIQFAENNGLMICPHFDKRKVKEAVENLQAIIIPDNISYRIHYTELYSKGEKIEFPENIRHISQRFQDQEENRIQRKYDPSKIVPIKHFKDGEIADDAMAELLRKPIKKN